MKNCVVNTIVITTAALVFAPARGQQIAHADPAVRPVPINQLTKVYRETADLPEFTKAMRRAEALSKYSPIDAAAVARSSKWDTDATAAREQLPGMYPEDAERLRRELEQRGRN